MKYWKVINFHDLIHFTLRIRTSKSIVLFLLQDAGKNWSLKLDRSTNYFPIAPPSVLFQIGFKIFFTKFYIDEILIKKKTNNDNVPPDRQLELAHASNWHASTKINM